VARREEWLEQVKLARLLAKWMDPASSFWTATDPVAPSVTSGAMRKKRGVKPGVPDVLVWYCGKSIAIELKSRRGQCSPSQRLAREALLRAGAQWWVCRSATAAMWALCESGVPFRTVVNEDGTIERWQQPELAAWEVPKRDPHKRRPRAPDYWEPEEAAEFAELSAGTDSATGGDIAA
jgi:VRR-NUC domain-containing protein